MEFEKLILVFRREILVCFVFTLLMKAWILFDRVGVGRICFCKTILTIDVGCGGYYPLHPWDHFIQAQDMPV